MDMGIKTESYISVGKLQIKKSLYELVKNKIAPKTAITNKNFWASLEKILHDFMPENATLLKKRDTLQKKIDAWHLEHRSKKHKPAAYKKFLKEIGYLVDEIEDFKLKTSNIDDEIALIPGPQLVVPLDNARYVLNAVNARWGSLYDASYSTDTIHKRMDAERLRIIIQSVVSALFYVGVTYSTDTLLWKETHTNM